MKIVYFIQRNVVFSPKTNVDGLFVVSDLEKWLNFGKDGATEKELISC